MLTRPQRAEWETLAAAASYDVRALSGTVYGPDSYDELIVAVANHITHLEGVLRMVVGPECLDHIRCGAAVSEIDVLRANTQWRGAERGHALGTLRENRDAAALDMHTMLMGERPYGGSTCS